MLRQDISLSDKFAALSKPAQVLFCLIIPHLNAHGKMDGLPLFIKGLCVPRIKYLTPKRIVDCLIEITEKTNLKWYLIDGRYYIQSLTWQEHQELRGDRLGADSIPEYPGYSGSTPGYSIPEVEVEVEGKGEVKVQVEEEGAAAPPLEVVTSFPTAKKGHTWPLTKAKIKEYQDTYPHLEVPKIIMFARQWCIDNPTRRKTPAGMPAFLGRWLAKEADRPKGGTYGGGRSKVAGEATPEPGKYEGLG